MVLQVAGCGIHVPQAGPFTSIYGIHISARLYVIATKPSISEYSSLFFLPSCSNQYLINMMQICRAEDGQVFQVGIHLYLSNFRTTKSMGQVNAIFPRHRKVLVSFATFFESQHIALDRSGSLELFLHHQTGVDEEAVLAYLSDGRRLRNDNIRDLAGAEDQVCMFDLSNQPRWSL